jgi:hypothetical protein
MAEKTTGSPVWLLPLLRRVSAELWRRIVQTAADEVLDNGVLIIGGRPGDADLARAGGFRPSIRTYAHGR